MRNHSRYLVLAAAFLAGTSLGALAQTNSATGAGNGALGPSLPGATGNGPNYLNGNGAKPSNDANGGIRTASVDLNGAGFGLDTGIVRIRIGG